VNIPVGNHAFHVSSSALSRNKHKFPR
jgi:hypothetical protein